MSREKKQPKGSRKSKQQPKKGDSRRESEGRREPVELEPELERLIGLATD